MFIIRLSEIVKSQMCGILQISDALVLFCFFFCCESRLGNSGSFAFLDSSKFTTNSSINSTIVFYSPIPTISFLPHQKTLIRTKVTLAQTFKAKRTTFRFQTVKLRYNGKIYEGASSKIGSTSAILGTYLQLIVHLVFF